LKLPNSVSFQQLLMGQNDQSLRADRRLGGSDEIVEPHQQLKGHWPELPR